MSASSEKNLTIAARPAARGGEARGFLRSKAPQRQAAYNVKRTTFAGLSLLGAISCNASPRGVEHLDITYETERTEVGTSFERALCRGDLEFLDYTAAEIELRLGQLDSAKHSVFLYAEPPPQCENDSLGCYLTDVDAVASTWEAVGHELVHSVFAHRYGAPAEQFWSEGIAEAMSDATVDEERNAASMIVSDTDDDYFAASHMTNWVIRSNGGFAAATQLALGVPPELVLGVGAKELETQYRESAASAYPSLVPRCPARMATVPELASNRWGETIEFDCDSTDVSSFGSFHNYSVARYMRVTAGSTYSVRVEGDGEVALYGCVDRPFAQPVRALEHGDIPMEVEPWFVDAPSALLLQPGPATQVRAGFEGVVKILIESDRERAQVSYEIVET